MNQSSLPVASRLTGRKLVWLVGVAVGILLIGGLIRYITASGDHTTTSLLSRTFAGSVARTPAPHYGEMNLGVPFGASPVQVLRELGSPTAKRLGCWDYRGRAEDIRGRYSGPNVNVVRFCFADGATGAKVVSQIFSHYVSFTVRRQDPLTGAITKQRYPAHWGLPLLIQKVPPWYLQQNS